MTGIIYIIDLHPEVEVHSQSQRDSLDSGAISITTTSLFLVEMASIVGNTVSLATGITDYMQSIFRAILTENGIADADEAVLEQEMVMFFKFSELQRSCHIQSNHIQYIRIESGWEG